MSMLMIRQIVLVVFLLAGHALAYGDEPLPFYFGTSPGALAEAKSRLAAHDPALEPALNALIRAADKALEVVPPSVMDKGRIPPKRRQARLHDYRALLLARSQQVEWAALYPP